jgi:YNFM family putative membrane transporter
LIIAYINEEFEPFNVGTVIGIYISGTTVGGLFGRLVVSAITDFVSWRMGLIVIGILYLAVGIAFFMLLPKPKYQRQRQSGGLQLIKTFHTALANKKLLWIYLVAFLIMGSFVAVFNFISYVLLAPPYSLSQTVVGLLFVVYLFGTFSSTYMGRLSDQHGNGRVLILGLLIMLTGGLLTLLQPLVFKFIGLAIFTFGMLGSHSVACGWVGKLNQVIVDVYVFLLCRCKLTGYFRRRIFGKLWLERCYRHGCYCGYYLPPCSSQAGTVGKPAFIVASLIK